MLIKIVTVLAIASAFSLLASSLMTWASGQSPPKVAFFTLLFMATIVAILLALAVYFHRGMVGTR